MKVDREQGTLSLVAAIVLSIGVLEPIAIGDETTLDLLAIPFDQSPWFFTPLRRHQQTELKKLESRRIEFTTDNSAAGLGRFLNPAWEFLDTRPHELRIGAQVLQFPKSPPTPARSRAEDDYAVRIGLLLSCDPTKNTPVLRAIDLRPFHAPADSPRIDAVIFLAASPPAAKDAPLPPSGTYGCRPSPYHRQIVDCRIATASDSTWSLTLPISWKSDLLQEAAQALDRSVLSPAEILRNPLRTDFPTRSCSPKLTGVWVIADSDNSMSSSRAILTQLELRPDLATSDKHRNSMK